MDGVHDNRRPWLYGPDIRLFELFSTVFGEEKTILSLALVPWKDSSPRWVLKLEYARMSHLVGMSSTVDEQEEEQ